MDKFSKEDLEKIFNDIYNNKTVQKERNFSFITGPEGAKQFKRALEYEMIMTELELSKHNNEQKENMKKLLNSGLDSDFLLVKEILNVK